MRSAQGERHSCRRYNPAADEGERAGLVIAQALLDECWDFADPAGSADRFAGESGSDHYLPSERLELLTQQARALGMQGRFDEGHALLDGLDSSSDSVVMARIALERGRLRNSAGESAASVADFEAALGLARSADHEFLEIDALHMLAIADSAQAQKWTMLGIQRAEHSVDPRTRRWLVSLWNNLGWNRFEAGNLGLALDAFRKAARWACEFGTDQQRQWAAEAISECEAALASRN